MSAQLGDVIAAHTEADVAPARARWWPMRSGRRIVLVLAALTVGGFGVLHLAGARATVGVLSGSTGSDATVVIGLAYAAAWFATAIAVPIALLALGFDAMLRRAAGWRAARRR